MAQTSNNHAESPDAPDQTLPSDARETIDTLNKFAWELRHVDSASSLTYGQKAYELSKAESYANGIVRSLLVIGISNHFAGNYDRALSQLLEAQSQAEAIGDLHSQSEAMLNVAQTYNLLGSLPAALAYALKAIEKCRAAGYQTGEAGAYNSMGIIQDKLGNYQQALDAFKVSLQIHRDTGNRAGEAELLNNIATLYFSLRDFDNALVSAYQGLQIAQDMHINLLEANVMCTIGDIQLARGNTEAALDYFEKSVTLARHLGFTYLEMYAQLSIGQLHLHYHRVDQAIPYLQSALDIATKIDTKSELYRCHQLLSQSFKLKGDFETALYHYEQYHQVYQDVFNQESDKRVRYLQIAHNTETAQKEAEIYRLRNVELERLVDELDAFAHTVAHDLKNPLSMIMGYAALLLEDRSEFTEDDVQNMLQSLANGAVKMSEIIDALLLLAGIRSMGEVEIRDVDMAPLVRAVQQRFPNLIDERHAKIKLPSSWPIARGYIPWIEEVWSNYLSNALKYGGNPPIIEFGAAVQPDGMIRFWVHDNGPGLTQAEQAQLFTPFTRLSHTRIEGHGLGLSIVRRIVERLGGQVGIESSPGAGSTFSFTLPATISN